MTSTGSVSAIQKLQEIREFAGEPRTRGLPDDVIERFHATRPSLRRAIDSALDYHRELRETYGAQLAGDEDSLIQDLQSSLVNFYKPETVNPYVPLAAAGPWIVTSHGAVVHDNGGYGMLGHGHGPDAVIQAMSRDWVMANVMTPSFSQDRLIQRLKAEIGQTREGGCPYARFVFLNSGSESVTLAARISDSRARVRTDPGGPNAGQPVQFVAHRGGFHGRTCRPAQLSDSCRKIYEERLASFRGLDNLSLIEPNNIEMLHQVFDAAEAAGRFIEAMFIEPVMGEGNPGQAVSREFYDQARERTRRHGGFLVVDSIQAGLRCHGVLSIVDYPGFADCDPPDMETYSKALNAGQYPLSVVALSDEAATTYVKGTYGNTMTTNPRALEVACATIAAVTPELRANIVERGAEFLEKLEALRQEFPSAVVSVRGTGLLCAAELDPEKLPVVGFGKVEEYCRVRGLGVIHGGRNALRFTPHFRLTSDEIDLIVGIVRDAILHFTG